MHTQLQDHGRRLQAVVGNFVTRTNLHGKPFPPAQAEYWVLKIRRYKSSIRSSRGHQSCWRRGDLDGDLHGEMVRRAPDPGPLQRNRVARIVHTATRTRFWFPTMPLDGSKSTQPGPGT